MLAAGVPDVFNSGSFRYYRDNTA
ncbi:hypothetical protein VTL71DRAFT_11487 [Oculimacula yallundae]|uniref:Uncharacterized protein n=1 Tax=Oculimacula yallundae TaxID=86028 RepID=A0ABR4CQC5_9HELO